MRVLGLSDGPDAGAALVVNDRVVAVSHQAHHDRGRRSRAFPWDAMQAVLDHDGLTPADIDLVAVAGRLSPPLVVRRHPELLQLADDAFSPARDMAVAMTALLRHSGLGELEADRAADFFEEKLAGRGYAPSRVLMVDIHRALASSAYRDQPRDDVLVVALHPMGDGAAVTVRAARGGTQHLKWTQRGFSAMHVHLRRCAAVMGLRYPHDAARLWGLAGQGRPDRALVALLADELRAEGPGFSRRAYPRPARRDDPPYGALATATPAVAAASVLAGLIDAVRGVVRHHLRHTGARHLVLCGDVVDNPRLYAAVAELEEVDTLWVPPEPGYAGLALGAAASIAGLGPHPTEPALGLAPAPGALATALDAAGSTHRPTEDDGETLATLLAADLAVARFSGRVGRGRYALGRRSVLMRADRPEVLAAARAALRLGPDEEPAFASREGGPAELPARFVGDAARYGVVAVPAGRLADAYPAAVARDGRAIPLRIDAHADPVLYDALQRLERRTGCAALAVLPLALEHGPLCASADDAVAAWRSSGLGALVGDGLVARADPPGGR